MWHDDGTLKEGWDMVVALQVMLGFGCGLFAGWFLGHLLGKRIRGLDSWRYWVLNATVVIAGGSLDAIGLIEGKTWLWVGATAFVGSALAGLKYGRGLTSSGGNHEAPPEPELEPVPPNLWTED